MHSWNETVRVMIVWVILIFSLMRKYISKSYITKTSNKAVQVCGAELDAVDSLLKGTVVRLALCTVFSEFITFKHRRV